MEKGKWKSRTGLGVAASAVLALGIGVAMAVAIFSQTIPTVAGTPAALTLGPCGNTLVATPSAVPYGGGLVIASCAGTGSGEAFDVGSTTTSVTPTFSLPGGASDLYVLPAADTPTTTCGSDSSAVALTSGSPMTFGATGAYNYCIDATGGFTSFDVSWSQ
jgi:hypothetical protein